MAENVWKDVFYVLSVLAANVGSWEASHFLSVIHYVDFHKDVAKAHVREAGHCIRIARAHKLELVVREVFIKVQYRYLERRLNSSSGWT